MKVKVINDHLAMAVSGSNDSCWNAQVFFKKPYRFATTPTMGREEGLEGASIRSDRGDLSQLWKF